MKSVFPRTFVAAIRGAAITALWAAPLFTAAQPVPYPVKPVRVVVPFAPGGPADMLARTLASKLSASTNQPFIVDNKPGGGTVIAWDYVAKSTADGYTLLVGGAGSRSIVPSVATLPFDPAKDLLAITRLANSPNILVASPQSELRTLSDLVTQAKAAPGTINVAIPAPATLNHFASRMLQRDAGIQLTEVPYRGGAPAVIALLGGEVQTMIADLGAVMPQLQGGKFQALAVATRSRVPGLPSVPTMAEAGLPNLVAVNVWGLFAPAGTPKEIVAKLAALSAHVLNSPETREQFARQGMLVETSTPEAFESFLLEHTVLWAPIAKASGLRLN